MPWLPFSSHSSSTGETTWAEVATLGSGEACRGATARTDGSASRCVEIREKGQGREISLYQPTLRSGVVQIATAHATGRRQNVAGLPVLPHERDPDGRASGFLVPYVQEEQVIPGLGLVFLYPPHDHGRLTRSSSGIFPFHIRTSNACGSRAGLLSTRAPRVLQDELARGDVPVERRIDTGWVCPLSPVIASSCKLRMKKSGKMCECLNGSAEPQRRQAVCSLSSGSLSPPSMWHNHRGVAPSGSASRLVLGDTRAGQRQEACHIAAERESVMLTLLVVPLLLGAGWAYLAGAARFFATHSTPRHQRGYGLSHACAWHRCWCAQGAPPRGA
jgi:hypothetical protein